MCPDLWIQKVSNGSKLGYSIIEIYLDIPSMTMHIQLDVLNVLTTLFSIAIGKELNSKNGECEKLNMINYL